MNSGTRGQQSGSAALHYNPVFGARPLTRFLQRTIETKLARALIAGEVGEEADLIFTVQNDELALVQDAPAAKNQA